MSKALSRRKKREFKRGYYAMLDAVVQDKWLQRGYRLHPVLIRRMRRAHFKRKPGVLVFHGRNGSATLHLDGRAP